MTLALEYEPFSFRPTHKEGIAHKNGQVSAAKSECSTAVALTYQETDFGGSVIVAVGGRCIDLHETYAPNVMSLPRAIYSRTFQFCTVIFKLPPSAKQKGSTTKPER